MHGAKRVKQLCSLLSRQVHILRYQQRQQSNVNVHIIKKPFCRVTPQGTLHL